MEPLNQLCIFLIIFFIANGISHPFGIIILILQNQIFLFIQFSVHFHCFSLGRMTVFYIYDNISIAIKLFYQFDRGNIWIIWMCCFSLHTSFINISLFQKWLSILFSFKIIFYFYFYSLLIKFCWTFPPV